MSHTHRFETLAIHAGQAPDPTTGAVCTPVYMTSTYAQSAPGVHKGYDYSRADNPTRTALEANLAALEGAAYGVCFASGCAATSAVAHWLGQGAHMIVSDDCYGGTYRVLSQLFAQADRAFSFVDLTDPDAIAKHARPETKAVWIETPTNPLLKIVDIKRIAAEAHARGLSVIVDNTFMSPYLQRPLALGADIVIHSATKYLGGHSDIILGAAITNDDAIAQRLHFIQKSTGGVPGPMDCFLALRGTKTLAVRMKAHQENAQALAEWLEAHPQVERVIYPGLPSHPQHEIAKAQMSGFGGMISFVVKGGVEAATRVLSRCQVFTLAESLGGVESLIEHPAIMTHASVPVEIREALGIVGGLIRVSVGIEHVEDLRADLAQALSL
ncbi:cystathionine gamma-synthase [Myxococcota bacterium]|nr:cystathionine gamma-synthase [Myxococcota bacterium]MBU1429882.1 cystathionine gamma-synthase [Myxococcota bacterium]MBU1897387.1 cystathionine gamma-synthase [Myxococcota bacterium]